MPNQTNYDKVKRKKQGEWNENRGHPVFPYVPRPTKLKEKALMQEIEQEERKRIIKERPFSVPDYRTGDVLDVTMFHSLSEGKFTTYRGLVIGRKKPNSLLIILFL